MVERKTRNHELGEAAKFETNKDLDGRQEIPEIE
jgi:hypothetical protein